MNKGLKGININELDKLIIEINNRLELINVNIRKIDAIIQEASISKMTSNLRVEYESIKLENKKVVANLMLYRDDLYKVKSLYENIDYESKLLLNKEVK